MAWLRPGQGTWSREDSAGVAEGVSDRLGSELGWARSSEPVSGGEMSSHVAAGCITKLGAVISIQRLPSG